MGSAAIGKWSLQRFREVPCEVLNGDQLEDFMAHHSHLRPGVVDGVLFEIEDGPMSNPLSDSLKNSGD